MFELNLDSTVARRENFLKPCTLRFEALRLDKILVGYVLKYVWLDSRLLFRFGRASFNFVRFPSLRERRLSYRPWHISQRHISTLSVSIELGHLVERIYLRQRCSDG